MFLLLVLVVQLRPLWGLRSHAVDSLQNNEQVQPQHAQAEISMVEADMFKKEIWYFQVFVFSKGFFIGFITLFGVQIRFTDQQIHCSTRQADVQETAADHVDLVSRQDEGSNQSAAVLQDGTGEMSCEKNC